MAMSKSQRVGSLIIVLLVVMQFVQPKKNQSEGVSENDISKVYSVPPELNQMLAKKCLDCHSNNTRYPWYANVQPIGWWLAAHVHDGKEELNFSEFKTYSPKRVAHKMEELVEVVEDREMPLKAYTIFHAGSKITPEDEKMIKAWVASLNLPKGN
jgi:hypothetical protein